MNNSFDGALSHARDGWVVFPCRPQSKAPATENGFYDASSDESQIHQWLKENPAYNVGLPTGRINGFFVPDMDSESALEEAVRRGFVPATTLFGDEGDIGRVVDAPLVRTGRGFHICFKYPEGVGEIRSGTGVLGPELDVKADGGYVLAPGSVHPSGAVYEYVNAHREPAEAPEALLKAITERPNAIARSADFSKPIAEGERNAALTRIAGQLTRLGLDSKSTRETLHLINRNQCTPPLPDEEVDGITLYDNALDEGGNDGEGDTVEFLDLGEAMENGVEPPTQLVEGLLYERGIHSVCSPAGTGKTILGLWVTKQVMEQGKTVVYVDEENGWYHILDLLNCMGVDPGLLSKYFKYADAPGLSSADIAKWQRTIAMHEPALTVFDSFADHLALDNLNENDAVEVTGWIKAFAQPVKDLGGAVLILDHVAKDTSTKGPRGSTAKVAKVDVSWRLSCDSRFDRDTMGRITMSREKDRMGVMPGKQSFAVGGDGRGRLACSPEGSVHAEPETEPLTEKQQQIHDTLITDFPNGAKAGTLIDAMGMANSTFYREVKDMPARYVFKDENTGLYHATLSEDPDGSDEKAKDTLSHSHHPMGGSGESDGSCESERVELFKREALGEMDEES